MSKIILLNGSKIEIYNSWSQTLESNGTIKYHDQVSGNLLITISTSGVVNITNACRHTYYPPEVNDKDHALKIVMQNLKELSTYKVADLKKALVLFNAKGKFWR